MARYLLATVRKGGETKEVLYPSGGGKYDASQQIRKLQREGWTVLKSTTVNKSGSSYSGAFLGKYQADIPLMKEQQQEFIAEGSPVGVDPFKTYVVPKKEEQKYVVTDPVKQQSYVATESELTGIAAAQSTFTKQPATIKTKSTKDVVSDVYGSATPLEKFGFHAHTFLSPSGLKYLSSPIQTGVSKLFPTKVEPLSGEDVVFERMGATYEAEAFRTDKKNKNWQFARGALGGLASPPGIVGTSYLGGAILGGATATTAGAKVLSKPLVSRGMEFGFGYLIGKTGLSSTEKISKGEVAEGVGEVAGLGLGLYGGYKGFVEGQKAVDIFRTKGLQPVPTKQLVPEDVLTGKTRFPEAGSVRMTSYERARLHQELFATKSQRLPGQTKPQAYHATQSEWGELVAGTGSSELPGVYGSYGVSPHFTRVSKAKYKLFGKPEYTAKPTVYSFEPTKVKIGKLATEEGALTVPGMKTEVEGVFAPGTKFVETRRSYYFEYQKRRIPIIEAEAITGKTTKLKSSSLKSSNKSLASSLGLSEYTYFVTPATGLIGSLSSSFKPSKSTSTPITYSYLAGYSKDVKPSSTGSLSVFKSGINLPENIFKFSRTGKPTYGKIPLSTYTPPTPPTSSIFTSGSSYSKPYSRASRTTVFDEISYKPPKKPKGGFDFKLPEGKERLFKKSGKRKKRKYKYTPSLGGLLSPKRLKKAPKGTLSGLETRLKVGKKKKRNLWFK